MKNRRIPPAMTHAEFVKKMLSDPEVKAEYDKLEEEFALLDEILAARKAAGLTQEQLAERMGTRQSSIARLENGLACGNLPSMTMLKKYAEAVGKKLQIRFV
ncbi:MAG: helix-turn-helix domain-containing protein [Alistipes senegalensis]|nr:helix-turn-helix domain-containing protein [Oxalobacter formigenes]MCM1280675.1 helix-turn-helix domain-containing protein [Alistipes senegalensis]